MPPPSTTILGKVDPYGNFLIDMPPHHVHIDDRNFFSRYLWVERQKAEKEARIEAFSKPFAFDTVIELIKEVTLEEYAKYSTVWQLYVDAVSSILQVPAFQPDENYYRTEVVYKEGQFGVFNPLLLELS